MGLDVGEKRIGVAVSDLEGKIAFPLKVVPREGGDVRTVLNLLQESEAEEVVVDINSKA